MYLFDQGMSPLLNMLAFAIDSIVHLLKLRKSSIHRYKIFSLPVILSNWCFFRFSIFGIYSTGIFLNRRFPALQTLLYTTQEANAISINLCKITWGRIQGRNPDKSLKEFSSLLFKVTSTALPWDSYFFKLTQPLTVFTVQLLFTVKEKGGKPNRKPYPPL
jgi:hypothetical protein